MSKDHLRKKVSNNKKGEGEKMGNALKKNGRKHGGANRIGSKVAGKSGTQALKCAHRHLGRSEKGQKRASGNRGGKPRLIGSPSKEYAPWE